MKWQLQPELSHKDAFKEAARNWGIADANPSAKRADIDGEISAPAPEHLDAKSAVVGTGEEGVDDHVEKEEQDDGKAVEVRAQGLYFFFAAHARRYCRLRRP